MMQDTISFGQNYVGEWASKVEFSFFLELQKKKRKKNNNEE